MTNSEIFHDCPPDGLDLDEAYNLGLVGVAGLFDQDPECQEMDHEPKPTTEWDDVFSRRIAGMPINVLKDMGQEDEAWAVARGTLDSDAFTRGEARKLLLDSYVKYAVWFTRETMGFHKSSEQDGYKRRSVIGAGYLQNYSGAPLEYADRLQEAMLSMWQAIKKFDPDGEARFITFARFPLERDLVNAIARCSHDYVSRFPAGQHRKQQKFRAAIARAESEGRQPNLSETIFEVSADEKELRKIEGWERIMGNTSYDELADTARKMQVFIDDGGVLDVSDLVSDPRAEGIMNEFVDRVGHEVLAKAISDDAKLNGQEIEVIKDRFLGETRLSLQEIGNKMDLSKERIRQIEKGALAKLGLAASRMKREGVFPPEDTGYEGSCVGPESIPLPDALRDAMRAAPAVVYDGSASEKYANTSPNRPVAVDPKQWDW